MKLFKNILVLLLATILLSSCAYDFNRGLREFTIENNVIPPDFGKDSTSTLIIVERGIKRYDNNVKEQVLNEYHGNYVFIPGDSLYLKQTFRSRRGDTIVVLSDSVILKEYMNTVKYRYLIDREIKSITHSTANGGSKSFGMYKYIILDRITKKRYECTYSSSRYYQLIQALMINLEKARVQNK